MQDNNKKTPTNNFGLPNVVVPAEVLFNEKLTHSEKLLFGFIQNFTYNEYGYCWASNRYLSRLMNVKPETISGKISKLNKHGYLHLEYETNYNGETQRKVFINKKYQELYSEMLKEAFDKITNPLNQKSKPPPSKIKKDSDKTLNNINTDINSDIDNKENEKSEDFSEPSNNNKNYKEYTEQLRKRLAEIHENRNDLIPKTLKRNVTEKDCREMRLFYERDGYTNETIKKILKFLETQEPGNNGFLWLNQIQSIKGFRSKAEKVLLQAKQKEKNSAKKEKNGDGYYDRNIEQPLY